MYTRGTGGVLRGTWGTLGVLKASSVEYYAILSGLKRQFRGSERVLRRAELDEPHDQRAVGCARVPHVRDGRRRLHLRPRRPKWHRPQAHHLPGRVGEPSHEPQGDYQRLRVGGPDMLTRLRRQLLQKHPMLQSSLDIRQHSSPMQTSRWSASQHARAQPTMSGRHKRNLVLSDGDEGGCASASNTRVTGVHNGVG